MIPQTLTSKGNTFNTIFVSKETLSDEITDVLTKNNCSPIQMIKNLGLVENKLSGMKNIVIVDWQGDVQAILTALRSFMTQNIKMRVKMLLLVDQQIKDAITMLVKYDNVKYVFKPITKERLQVGLRMLLYEKKEAGDTESVKEAN